MASIKVMDFFNGRFFEIPKYQRGYAWEKQHVTDLFNDIIESIESGSNHYIGTLVLSKSCDDEMFYVVDGQQRITTITLLMNALIKHLDEKKRLIYHHNYIKDEDRYRLVPLGRDKQFLIDILDGKDVEPENKSQRFLKDAYEEIDQCVNTICDKLQFLKSVEKLEVMEFVENSEGDAIRIFQTVNDRGKPLSNMEKAKSLLIYFSNRYLNKQLDDTINNCFSELFELYDDIKVLGEKLKITLISRREFNEDDLMRYHFVSFSSENYDPTASYVLNHLKEKLTTLRKNEIEGKYPEMHDFIQRYITNLKQYFEATKRIIQRVEVEPKYYKLFSILNLSATLYPLITKLEMLDFLEMPLPSEEKKQHTFFDLVELIDVRVYKTRNTDPKADIGRFVSDIDKDSDLIQIEKWLIWFNAAWMSKEYYNTLLVGNMYGNRSLSLIFIEYCEMLRGKKYSIEELISIMNSTPTIEHILSQTPNFGPRALGFRTNEDFLEYEHRLGNLTLLEKRLNSQVQNKSAIDKADAYSKSKFKMTKVLSTEISLNRAFRKEELDNRTKMLVEFIIERWWC